MAKTKKTELQSPLMLLLLLLLMGFYGAQAVPSIQVCGDKLTDTLILVCQGHFATYGHDKRGSLDIFDYVDHQNEVNNGYDLDSLWRLPPKSHGSMMATRRLLRGVVDECCLKPCKLEELKQYCANRT